MPKYYIKYTVPCPFGSSHIGQVDPAAVGEAVGRGEDVGAGEDGAGAAGALAVLDHAQLKHGGKVL